MQHKFVKAKDFFNSIKETVYLYKNIWKEGTTALIHAPRDVDKTAKAIEIATDLAAAGREVLYINVDDRLETAMTEYVENLYIFKPQFEWPDDEIDYADLDFGAIEQAVSDTHIRTFVIDSVSRIAALSFGKNASAAYIMKRLVVMQMRYKISILAVAHDTTKSANNALLTLAASEIKIGVEEPADQPQSVAIVPEAYIPETDINTTILAVARSSRPYDKVDVDRDPTDQSGYSSRAKRTVER